MTDIEVIKRLAAESRTAKRQRIIHRLLAVGYGLLFAAVWAGMFLLFFWEMTQ